MKSSRRSRVVSPSFQNSSFSESSKSCKIGRSSLSLSSGVFSLTKSILGASTVNIPFVFASLGVVLGSVCVFLMMIINIFSLNSLMLAGKEIGAGGLSDLGEYTNKRGGKITVNILLFATCIVPLSMYIKLSTNYYLSFISHITKKENISLEIVRLFTALTCGILCIIFRRVDKLQPASIVGLGSLLLFCFYVIGLFFSEINKIAWNEVPKFKISILGLEQFCFICFAFCSQFSILSITDNIEKESTCKKVIFISNIASGILYALTGFCGASYNPKCHEQFLNYEPGAKKTLLIESLKLLLGSVNVLTFPLIMMAARSAFHSFLVPIMPKRLRSMALIENSESVILTALAYFISVLARKNDLLLISIFFLVGSLVMFAMPSYFYYKVFGKNGERIYDIFMIFNILLTLFGIYMSLSGFYKIIFGGELS